MAINLNATATIDIHADHFQEFLKNFNRMQQSMNQMPGQWQNIQRASILATAQMRAATMAMQQAAQAATSNLNNFGASIQRTGYNLRTHLLNPMAQFFSSMGRGAGSWMFGGGGNRVSPGAFAAMMGGGGGGGGAGGGGGRGGGGIPPGGFRGTFGRGQFFNRGMMLPFGLGGFSMQSLMMGLAGGGGLYGLASLAESAASTRSYYMGIGSNYGEAKSYGLFDRFFNGKEFLSNMGRAQSSIGPLGTAIMSLGGNIDPYAKQTPGQLGTQVLRSLRQQHAGKSAFDLGLAFNAQHIGEYLPFEGFRSMMGSSNEEFEQQMKLLQENETALKAADDAIRTWQQLNQTLKTSQSLLEKGFTEAFAPLAKPIGDLSTAFTKLTISVLNNPLMKFSVDVIGKGTSSVARLLEGAANGNLGEVFMNMVHEDPLFTKKHWTDAGKAWGRVLPEPVTRTLGAFWGSIQDASINHPDVMKDRGPLGKLGDWLFGKIVGANDYIGNTAAGVYNSAAGAASSAYNWGTNFSIGNTGGTGSGFNPFTGNLNAYDQAILKTLGIEGGAKGYDAIGLDVNYGKGRVDRAYGAYQVMGQNIRDWTRKWATRGEMSPEEFLKDHAAQDQVALGQFKEYVDRFGGPSNPEALLRAFASWHSPVIGAGPLSGFSGAMDKAIPNLSVLQTMYQKANMWNAQPGVLKIALEQYFPTGSYTTQSMTTPPPGPWTAPY